MTAKQVQIGDRPCRIYGVDCAEYLLLQMTDEHELQRMDNEVAAIAQGAAHPFLFAAGSGGKLERCTFPVGKPLLSGESRGSAARLGTLCAF